MNNKDIVYIKNNLKWPYKSGEIYNHYFILLFPLFLIWISSNELYDVFKFENFSPEFLCTNILILLFGILSLIFMFNRIYSEKKFKLLVLENLIFEDIKNIFDKSNWFITESKKEYLFISTKTTYFSWGETITIIKIDENEILINSRPDRQPFTINRDKINYNKFEKLVKNYY